MSSSSSVSARLRCCWVACFALAGYSQEDGLACHVLTIAHQSPSNQRISWLLIHEQCDTLPLFLDLPQIKNTAAPGEPRVYEEKTFEFDPKSVGIERCELIDLKGGGPEENAEKFRAVLQGGEESDAKRDSIVLNAGVGCYVYGLTPSIEEGCDLARKTLNSGKAAELLNKWIEVSQSIAAA